MNATAYAMHVRGTATKMLAGQMSGARCNSRWGARAALRDLPRFAEILRDSPRFAEICRDGDSHSFFATFRRVRHVGRAGPLPRHSQAEGGVCVCWPYRGEGSLRLPCFVSRSLRTNSHWRSSRSGPSLSASSTPPFPPPAAPSRSLTMRAKAAAAQRSGAPSPLTSPQYGTRTMRRARWRRDTGGDVATIVLDRPAMRRAR